MSGAAALPDDLFERLTIAQESVLVDETPDWWALVLLSADLILAGAESPAAVQLAGMPAGVGRSECEATFQRLVIELGLRPVPDTPRVLRHLVDEADFGTLLTVKSVPDIAAAWLGYHHRCGQGVDSDDAGWWAVALWMMQDWYDGEWPQHELLLEMIRQAETEDLGKIGAGPLENLICDAEPVLRWAEEHAERDPRFRAALAGIWVWSHLSPASFERLERAAGTRLANPSHKD